MKKRWGSRPRRDKKSWSRWCSFFPSDHKPIDLVKSLQKQKEKGNDEAHQTNSSHRGDGGSDHPERRIDRQGAGSDSRLTTSKEVKHKAR